jgi:hypothetical protein
MASSTHYRNRSNNTNDETSKDLKTNVRESRWIQPEQWQSAEIQAKFEKVTKSSFSKIISTFISFLRVLLISRKFMVCYKN